MTFGLRYQPDREQLALAGAIGDSLAAILPVTRLRQSWHESGEVWSALGELGLFDLAVAEERGGSGLGATEEVLIAMALGRHLAAPAVFATLGAAHASLEGERPARVAAAFGAAGATLVEEPGATLVLAWHDSTAALHPASPAVRIDHDMWAADIARITAPAAPVARIDEAGMTRLRLISAAALAGIAAATLDMAVDYAGTREQFGRPIGSFQAIKHHCANMAIAARSAGDLATFAAVAVDEGRADAAMRADCAFLIAASAAIDNAGTNIQVHGGIGFSEEADPHLYLKRARLLAAIGGGVEAATTRLSIDQETPCRLQ